MLLTVGALCAPVDQCDEVVTCHQCDEAKEEVQCIAVQAEVRGRGQKVNRDNK